MEPPLLLRKFKLKALNYFFIIELGILLVVLVVSIFWDKRYRKNHGSNIPAGFNETKEVIVDPKSGEKLKVYYNPTTGERFYSKDNS